MMPLAQETVAASLTANSASLCLRLCVCVSGVSPIFAGQFGKTVPNWPLSLSSANFTLLRRLELLLLLSQR